ncbi:translational machinery component [Hypoxylon sp. FL0890]|nr:translational machinery component [Hypoxylon sp. FL0890]
MSRASSRLLATTRTHTHISSPSNYHYVRPFSQTCLRQEEVKRPASLLDRLPRSSPTPQSTGPPRPGSADSMAALQRILAHDTVARARNQPTARDQQQGEETKGREDWGPPDEPFHFHIFAHRHNSHVTVTKPNRNAIISMSTGNIGFKKSKRGTYDAAYQLLSYVIDKLHQGNWHNNINAMEVVLRGFGHGREAAVKVLLGTEGRTLRDKIVKVSDATRLKFGGTRSRKPRRLG